MTTLDPLLVCIFIMVLIVYTAIAVYFGFLAKEKMERFQKWLESLKGEKKE